MSCIAFAFLLSSCIGIGSIHAAQPQQVDSPCLSYTGKISTTVGWPVSASCDDYFYQALEDSELEGDVDIVEFLCDIYMGGAMVGSYNGSYNIYGDMFYSKPYRVDVLSENVELEMMLTWQSGCARINYELVAVEEDYRHQNDCPLYSSTAQAEDAVAQIDIECNSLLTLDCRPFGDEIPIFLTNTSSYEVTWYRDCVPLAKDEYREIGISEEVDEWFSRIKVLGDFSKFSGTYSCQLSYKGMSRFISQKKVCITRPRPLRYDEMIEAQSLENEAQLGDDVLLQCSGSGAITDERYRTDRQYKWYKEMENGVSEEICSLEQKIGGSNLTVEDKYHCTELSDARPTETICERSPICKQFKNLTEKFTTTLLIRNLNTSDIGRYSCVVRTLQNNDTANLILLLARETPPVEYLTIILWAVSAFVLFVVLGCCMVSVFKTEIQLVWKKCCAAYDHDRPYAAYLAYSFSKGEDNDDTRSFLRLLHQWFETNCYDVYDEQKENTSDLRFESVINVAPTCHRMVVVLTKTFFKSDETMFDVQRGIIESISRKTSLIFIQMPEARRILDEKIKSKKGSSYRSLLSAMKSKRNDVILWEGYSRKSRFFRKLEVAMPKLRSPGYVISNSSCGSENELSEKGCRDRLRTVSSTLSDVPPSIV